MFVWFKNGVRHRLPALARPPMRLGEDLAFTHSVSDPIHGTKRYPNQMVAGSFLAIAVIGGSVAVGSA